MDLEGTWKLGEEEEVRALQMAQLFGEAGISLTLHPSGVIVPQLGKSVRDPDGPGRVKDLVKKVRDDEEEKAGISLTLHRPGDNVPHLGNSVTVTD